MAPTIRDRTQEFLATVSSYESLLPQKPNNFETKRSRASLSADSIEQSKRIHILANKITQNINESKDKVSQLEQLAKSTTNFRDERPKIQSLMLSIKKDIETINTNLKTLSAFIDQSFYSKEMNDCVNHHKAIAVVLKNRYSLLVKYFADACMVSTEFLQKQKSQREKFGHQSNRIYRKVPRNRLQTKRILDKNNNINEEENKPLLNGQQTQLMVLQQSQYNEQRSLEAQAIEKQLQEISEMMTKLATMVEEQRQTIIDIDNNVQDSIENVDGAIQQLQKYLASLSGNRWLMIKVFALLIFFALIFTLFIA